MKRSLKISLVWLAICCLLLIGVFIVGIGQAAGGGLSRTGVLLTILAGCSLALAFVHTWRKAWKYLLLLGASMIGFFVFVFLHNFFYALGEVTSNIAVLHYLFEFLHAASFLIAIFACPAFSLVGAVGSTVMCFKIAATSTKMNRKVIFILMAICCVALIVVYFVYFPLFY